RGAAGGGRGERVAGRPARGRRGEPAIAREGGIARACGRDRGTGASGRGDRGGDPRLARGQRGQPPPGDGAGPGIGPITATALVATAGEAPNFASARHFAAWIGLVPKRNGSGGKPRRGGIS